MARKKVTISAFITLLAIFCLNIAFASTNQSQNNKESEEKDFDVNGMIMHHIKDAHEWHLWGPEHGGTSIYLPIILIDGGVKVFSSSHFYHGSIQKVIDHKTKLEVEFISGSGPAKGYGLYHEKIYKLANETLQIEDGHVHGNTKTLDFSITKNVLSLFFGAFFILVIMASVARFYKKNGAVSPKGLAKFLEPLIVMVRDDVAKSNIGEHKYKKYVPYLLTIFFFIFFNIHNIVMKIERLAKATHKKEKAVTNEEKLLAAEEIDLAKAELKKGSLSVFLIFLFVCLQLLLFSIFDTRIH